ncbi:MAG TPA: sugar transferase [Anaerolineae bacterium]|nr:sugar transferase [Anaerolineae bacterium]
MAIQVNNHQEVTSTVNKSERLFLRNNKNPEFQALFSERRVLLMIGDALIVVLAVCVAVLLWHQTDSSGFNFAIDFREHWYWFPSMLGGWWLLAGLNDLYYIPSSFDKLTSAMRVATVGLINLAIYLALFSLIPQDLPRDIFLYFLLMVWPAITLWRWIYAELFSRFQHRVLIVGTGMRGQSLFKTLKEAPKLNYQVLGYVDDQTGSEKIDDGLDVIGKAADLPNLIRQLQIHEVAVAIDRRLSKDLFESLVECQANGVRVSLMSDIYQELYRKVPIEYIDPSWALYAMQNRLVFKRLDLGLKRVLDLILVSVGLLILAPIFPLLALAIRLDSSGPIFYRQIRCGRAGKPFSIYKFRTMVSDAEKDGKPQWATKNDQRITRVGRFMRKTRLDELPQLINVLRGEMSIIGPRPERPEFVKELQQEIPYYRTRLMVKPGLTGWAQIHYPYGNTVEDALIKLQYDFYYLRYWSLWLDLYIIFRTFAVVLQFKGT